MDFNSIYNELLFKIEARINELIVTKEPTIIYEPFRYAMTQGGKRIRPILTILTSAMFGTTIEKVLDLSLAIEILHNFTLVHDDIMDESPLRRNKLTVFKKYNIPLAIITGDLMVGFAYSLLPKSKENKNSDLIYEIFNKGLIDVCEGQALDMEFNSRNDITVNDYFDMISKKTSSLLETACLIGAYFSDANQNEINIIKDFAYHLGIAFQLQDDLLDLTAVESQLGKKIGQDIVEGKKTYFIIRTKELANEEKDILLIEKFYKNNGLKNEVNEMIELIKKLGIIEEANRIIDDNFNKCKILLRQLPKNQYNDMLDMIIDKLNKRRY